MRLRVLMGEMGRSLWVLMRCIVISNSYIRGGGVIDISIRVVSMYEDQ